jgi:hypothetical protein
LYQTRLAYPGQTNQTYDSLGAPEHVTDTLDPFDSGQTGFRPRFACLDPKFVINKIFAANAFVRMRSRAMPRPPIQALPDSFPHLQGCPGLIPQPCFDLPSVIEIDEQSGSVCHVPNTPWRSRNAESDVDPLELTIMYAPDWSASSWITGLATPLGRISDEIPEGGVSSALT